MDKNQVKQTIANGSNGIGALVWWTLRSARVSRETLREAAFALGVAKALPADPKPEACLRRAVSLFHEDSLMIRFKYADAVGAYYSVLTRNDTETGAMRWEEAGIVSTSKDRHLFSTVLYSEMATDEIRRDLESLRVKYHEIERYAGTADVSSFLVNVMGGRARDPISGAIMIRESGGVYYVSPDKVGLVRSVAGYIESISDSTVDVWAIASDADNLQKAPKRAFTALKAELEEIEEEAKRFVGSMSDKESNKRQINARINRFKTFRNKAELWSEVLGEYRDLIVGSINQAAEVLEKEIDFPVDRSI